MDEQLTASIKVILDTPDKEIDIDSAALVLLQLNRNRILFHNIINRRDVARLKYDLQKFYKFRITDNAVKETAELEKQAAVIVTQTMPKVEQLESETFGGMRPDHYNLPDEIKARYLENRNIYPRMRKLHEQLKLLNNGKPCDRYPYLKELKELDEQVRANWNAYDAFVIAPVNPDDKNPDNHSDGGENPPPMAPPVVVPDAKKISAARKYLSDNKAKLAELKALEDQSKYLALLDKMQERLSLLIETKAGVSDEELAKLKELGLNAQ